MDIAAAVPCYRVQPKMSSRKLLSVCTVTVALLLYSSSAVFAQSYPYPPVRPGVMGMGQCPEGSGSTSDSANGFSSSDFPSDVSGFPSDVSGFPSGVSASGSSSGVSGFPSGVSASGSSSGVSGFSGSSSDVSGFPSDVSGFPSGVSGFPSGVSASGSGDFEFCLDPAFNTFCAQVLSTSTDSDECVFQYSSQSCLFCQYFELLCGSPPVNNTQGFCSDEEVSDSCDKDPSSCVTDVDEDDQYLCDACVLFGSICVPRRETCADFGNEIYQECFNLLSITEYSCYCFAPGMTCDLCKLVVGLCAPISSSPPPSIFIVPVTSSIPVFTSVHPSTPTFSYIPPTSTAPSSSPSVPSFSTVSPSSSPAPFSSSSTSSPAASPTPTPGIPPTLPPDAERDFDDLSAEQQENSVTVEFTGIGRDAFLRVELLFRQGIIDAVRTQLGASGQNLSADDVIFIAPCPCERPASSRRRAFDGALEVPIFIQSSEPGSAVSADAVVSTVNESGADIAQDIGATFAGVEMGVPDDAVSPSSSPAPFSSSSTSSPAASPTPTPDVIPEEEEHDEDDDGGLTDGEVAAIVIVIVIVVVVTILIVVGVLIWQSKRRRKFEIATDSHNTYTAIPDSINPFQLVSPEQTSEHEKMAESHPIALQSKEGAQPVTSTDEAAVEQEEKEEEDKVAEDEDEERKEYLKPLLKSSDQDTHV